MARLFSYVVHHDRGYAPNPDGRVCSLAECKYGKHNIVELAQVGDWIVGTGGADLRKSAGHGKLIYAMRVDQKLPLKRYRDSSERIDAGGPDSPQGRFALLSRQFYYFGRNAIDVSEIPDEHLNHPFEKQGPGFRSDFSEEFIAQFATWLEVTFEPGRHGPPCMPRDDFQDKCPSGVRRKKRGCR